MRKILFRGKRIDNGEWVYGNFIEDTDGMTPYIVERAYWNCEDCKDETLYFEVIPETVGQYTGLTDKNGIKIFEGDLVEDFRCMKFEVIFKDSVFCLKQLNCDYYEFIAKYGRLIVIGNVHEVQNEN